MTRRKRRAAFAPRLETCEARELLSGYSGINIGANSTGSTDDMWVDATRTFGAWGSTVPSVSLELTPQGYPLSNAMAVSYLTDMPDGAYHLSFQGTATVSVAGMGRLAGPVVQGPDGVSRVDVTVDHATAGDLIISLSGLGPADPVHDMHLIQPGYDAGTTQVFTDAFLARLQPFSTVRLMDLEYTIVNPDVNWSDRTLPDDWLQTGTSGVAFEYLADLADESGKAIWVNVPTLAGDDYVTQLADLLRDEVTTGAPIYLEYSNETWNTSFPAYGQLLAAAATDPLVPAGASALQQVADQAALRAKQVGDIFRREFGARASQIEPVLGGWTAYSPFAQTELAFVNQNFGNPSQYFAAVTIGDYVTVSNPNRAGLTLNQVFSGMSGYMTGPLASGIKANVAAASAYGLPVAGYEGGQSLVSSVAANSALFAQAQSDPRMSQVYRQLMAQWEGLTGGGLACSFCLSGANGPWGDWGLLTGMNQPGSEKWDAVIGQLATPGDANLDGTVNFSDFTILAASYNQPGTWWWQQGDFTHDNKVDVNDLYLLRENLGAVTPAQEVPIALFDAPTADPTGARLTFDARGHAGALSFSWAATSNGVKVASGRSAVFAFAPAAGSTDVVTLTVTGPGGPTATGSVTVTGPPVVTPPAPATTATASTTALAPAQDVLGGTFEGYGATTAAGFPRKRGATVLA